MLLPMWVDVILVVVLIVASRWLVEHSSRTGPGVFGLAITILLVLDIGFGLVRGLFYVKHQYDYLDGFPTAADWDFHPFLMTGQWLAACFVIAGSMYLVWRIACLLGDTDYSDGRQAGYEEGIRQAWLTLRGPAEWRRVAMQRLRTAQQELSTAQEKESAAVAKRDDAKNRLLVLESELEQARASKLTDECSRIGRRKWRAQQHIAGSEAEIAAARSAVCSTAVLVQACERCIKARTRSKGLGNTIPHDVPSLADRQMIADEVERAINAELSTVATTANAPRSG